MLDKSNVLGAGYRVRVVKRGCFHALSRFLRSGKNSTWRDKASPRCV